MASQIRVIVWGENTHEHINEAVGRIYPNGMHFGSRAAKAFAPVESPWPGPK